MSPLAFDKQGKPFSWHASTAKLRVRLFRTPSSRGTCSQVLDGAGSPLFVDANIDYAEFCRVVGKVPGLYRFDQCDEDGVEIKDAPPGYMSIENLRNAGGASNDDAHDGQVSALAIIDRLMATQERLVATQAEVMKQMASQHAAMLAAGAEVMRAPYRPVPLLPASDLRNADAANDDADDSDDDEDETPEPSALAPMLRMLEPHLPQLGAFLYTKFVEFFRHVPAAPATTPPAATTPAPTPAASTASHVVPPVDVAAGFEPADIGIVEAELFEAVIDDASASEPRNDVAAVEVPMSSVATAPTAEQLAHLFAVRERLSPPEQTLVEHVIKRMPPELLTHYLGTLSAMSIDDATTFIRSLIAQARPSQAR